MYKVAVLGDYDSIYGFAAVGFDTFPVSGAEEGESTLKKLASENYGVIYITEALLAQIAEAVAEYNGQLVPAVIPIPGLTGNTGEGIASVRRSVEKAVGTDIIFKER